MRKVVMSWQKLQLDAHGDAALHRADVDIVRLESKMDPSRVGPAWTA
jgi:hypothetical protein